MDMTTKDELLDIERRLWTNDPGFYRTTLLPDAVLAFAETGVITRDRAVSAIELERAEGRHWGDSPLT